MHFCSVLYGYFQYASIESAELTVYTHTHTQIMIKWKGWDQRILYWESIIEDKEDRID